ECRARAIEPPPLEYEEPPVITPEQSKEWTEETPGLDEVQIVIDPGSATRAEPDDDPDTLDAREQAEVDRQLDEAMQQAGEKPREPLPEQEVEAPEPSRPPFDEKEQRKELRGEEKEERREEKREEKNDRKEQKPHP
ncbi:MAG TPA: hypothetical protein VF698_11100, partial [Thermoanaerobaculia bacterium]